MTALEIWQEDRAGRRDPENRRSRQEYFILLRDALHEELAKDGRSDFLEEMIAAGGKGIQALEFSALRECFASIVDGRRMKDAAHHVPHILRAENTPLTWEDMEKGSAFLVNDPKLPEMLVRLRNVSYQLANARDESHDADARKAVERELEGLRAVNQALQTDNRELRAQRDALRERVTQLEEGVISQQLQYKADARRHQMEDALKREMADKRAAAEREMHDALSAAARQEQQARETIRREAEEADVRRAAVYDTLRTQLQASLEKQMETLQTSLQAEDFRFLAQSYAELQGMFSREMPALLGNAPAHGADAQLLEGLAALSASVNAHLVRLEQAMQQLGLTVAYPEKGDAFDSALHSPASAAAGDAPEGERLIEAVESPAVRFIHADGAAQTLVRAVVHTSRRTAEE
ncbi:MAG: hypothetical protein IKK57_04340 [Clostridia bacterium]|nr:hypothetical protein [Clostridia bacterium]